MAVFRARPLRRLMPAVATAAQLLLLLLPSSPANFAAKDSLRSLRVRDGLELHTKASHKDSVLSKAGKDVLELIQEARAAGDWMRVKSLHAAYSDSEIQIYNAVLHTAFECVQYKAGAAIFDSLGKMNIAKTSTTYAAALKIFAKLGHNETVKTIWQEARDNPLCEMNAPLTAARIDAAAEEGDVESALQVLHDMQQMNISTNIAHITSAIRACWRAGGIMYKTAERLFDLSVRLRLEANIVTFACLVGAYGAAPLEKAQSAYTEMKQLGIEPNQPFADVYVATLLQKPLAASWRWGQILAELQQIHDESPARVEATRLAISEFKGLGVELSDFVVRVDRALQKLDAS